MSQAGANSSSGGGGGSGIETINTIGPDGGGNFTFESTDGSVTFTPIANGLNLSVPGSVGAVTTFDIDVGGPITPIAGVITLNGIGGNQTVTSGAGEIGFNNRRWFTQYVVNQSATPGSDAEYTTIQAAINDAAAAGGGEVYIQSSTTPYTEDLSLIGGVNITAVSADGRLAPYGGSAVILVGNHTFTGEGAIIIKGIYLNNTAGTMLTQSNTAGISLVGFINCQIISNGDFVNVSSTGTAAITSLLDTNLEAAGAVGIIGVGGTFSTIGAQMQSFSGSALQVAGNVALRTSTLTSSSVVVEITGLDASAGFDYCQFGGTIGVLMTVSGGVSADNCTWACTDTGGYYIAGAAGSYTQDNDNIFGPANQIDPRISLTKAAWRPRATAIAAPSNGQDFGVCAFDSAIFTLTDGWVTLSGGSTPAIQTIDGDTGSATGATITVFSNVASINSGSSVEFVASGSQVQFNVSDAGQNTMIGLGTGTGNMPGNASQCTGLGWNAFNAGNTNSGSTGIGAYALNADASGSDNTSIGCQSLISLNGGGGNIALGFQAGNAYTSIESSNIVIGSFGVLGESNVTRIGTQGSGGGQQDQCFIAGINGNTVANTNFVTIDTITGQLGTSAIATAFVWNTTSTNVANMTAENGYFCIAPGGALTLGLPATSALGDTVRVSLSGATSCQITQAAGQQIQLGSNTTTLGVTGTLTSTAQGDSVELVCLTANSLWVVQSSQGNLTLA